MWAITRGLQVKWWSSSKMVSLSETKLTEFFSPAHTEDCYYLFSVCRDRPPSSVCTGRGFVAAGSLAERIWTVIGLKAVNGSTAFRVRTKDSISKMLFRFQVYYPSIHHSHFYNTIFFALDTLETHTGPHPTHTKHTPSPLSTHTGAGGRSSSSSSSRTAPPSRLRDLDPPC